MPHNLELKARIPSIAWGVRAARSIGAIRVDLLVQTDTYFSVSAGRLKLREIRGVGSELIAYHRKDQKGGRYSKYHIVPVEDPRGLKGLLSRACGIHSVIKKRRILFRFQNARIHLDAVEGLGTFLEFEVEVKRGQLQARRLFDRLVHGFQVDLRKTISHSYSDLRRR